MAEVPYREPLFTNRTKEKMMPRFKAERIEGSLLWQVWDIECPNSPSEPMSQKEAEKLSQDWNEDFEDWVNET